ncbi:MAG: hypothetical protein AAGB00_02855 [Planctomycetota bacterium]
MSTADQIDDFAAFAHQAVAAGHEQLSIDELYDRWREQRTRDEDLAAIKAALASYDAGERSRPADEVIAELRAKVEGMRAG